MTFRNPEALKKFSDEFAELGALLRKSVATHELLENKAPAQKHYKNYADAYEKGELEQCAEEFLVALLQDSPQNFRKTVFHSNLVKNPMGKKYTPQDYEKTMQILNLAIRQAETDKYDEEKLRTLREFWLYTHVFYANCQVYLKRLKESAFFAYPFSQQVRMILIFIQSQSMLLSGRFLSQSQNESFVTAAAGTVAQLPVDDMPEVRQSYQDTYEGMLDRYGHLIAYAFYRHESDTLQDDAQTHGDIHPFALTYSREHL